MASAFQEAVGDIPQQELVENDPYSYSDDEDEDQGAIPEPFAELRPYDQTQLELHVFRLSGLSLEIDPELELSLLVTAGEDETVFSEVIKPSGVSWEHAVTELNIVATVTIGQLRRNPFFMFRLTCKGADGQDNWLAVGSYKRDMQLIKNVRTDLIRTVFLTFRDEGLGVMFPVSSAYDAFENHVQECGHCAFLEILLRQPLNEACACDWPPITEEDKICIRPYCAAYLRMLDIACQENRILVGSQITHSDIDRVSTPGSLRMFEYNADYNALSYTTWLCAHTDFSCKEISEKIRESIDCLVMTGWNWKIKTKKALQHLELHRFDTPNNFHFYYKNVAALTNVRDRFEDRNPSELEALALDEALCLRTFLTRFPSYKRHITGTLKDEAARMAQARFLWQKLHDDVDSQAPYQRQISSAELYLLASSLRLPIHVFFDKRDACGSITKCDCIFEDTVDLAVPSHTGYIAVMDQSFPRIARIGGFYGGHTVAMPHYRHLTPCILQASSNVHKLFMQLVHPDPTLYIQPSRFLEKSEEFVPAERRWQRAS